MKYRNWAAGTQRADLQGHAQGPEVSVVWAGILAWMKVRTAVPSSQDVKEMNAMMVSVLFQSVLSVLTAVVILLLLCSYCY